MRMNIHEGLILWSGCVRSKSLKERIKAAETGAFSGTTLFPGDVEAFKNEYGSNELRSHLARAAIEVNVVEPFAKWLPDEYWVPPERFSADDVAWLDFEEETFFELASAVDADKISVVEPFGTNVPTQIAAEAFGTVCDRAGERGFDVMLEFMATSGISTLEDGWEVVQQADRENGGLLFDTWHYFRTNPDHELLATLPGEKVFAVQLADGQADIDWSLAIDMLHHRHLPGEGDFEIVDTLCILDDIGGLRNIGPEVFSDDLDDISPDEVGRRAGEATHAVLDAAGISSHKR